ncbi:MAG: LysR family transcriptional regulator [Acidimicrobiales bacterium]
MDSKRLRAFVAVADAGSITAAARALHVAQPALSRQMHALERELGAVLLERTRAGVALTAAGRLLADRGRQVLAELDALEVEVRRRGGARARRLRIGVWAYTATDEIDALVRAFRPQGGGPEPEVELVNVTTGEERAALELVAEGRLDVSFSRLPARPVAGLRIETVRLEPMRAAVPERSALGRRSSTTLAELVGQPWAFFNRADDPAWFDQVMAACQRLAGRLPSVRFVGRNALDNLPHVATGDAVTVVSAALARQISVRGVRYRPIDGDPLAIPLTMVSRRTDRSAVLGELLELARARLGAAGAGEVPTGGTNVR